MYYRKKDLNADFSKKNPKILLLRSVEFQNVRLGVFAYMLEIMSNHIFIRRRGILQACKICIQR